jgi:hypothetical protein
MTPFLAADATWIWIQGFRSFFGAIWEGGWSKIVCVLENQKTFPRDKIIFSRNRSCGIQTGWNSFVAVVIISGCLPLLLMAVRAHHFRPETRAKWFMIYAVKNVMIATFSFLWTFVAFGWKWPAAGLIKWRVGTVKFHKPLNFQQLLMKFFYAFYTSNPYPFPHIPTLHPDMARQCSAVSIRWLHRVSIVRIIVQY